MLYVIISSLSLAPKSEGEKKNFWNAKIIQATPQNSHIIKFISNFWSALFSHFSLSLLYFFTLLSCIFIFVWYQTAATLHTPQDKLEAIFVKWEWNHRVVIMTRHNELNLVFTTLFNHHKRERSKIIAIPRNSQHEKRVKKFLLPSRHFFISSERSGSWKIAPKRRNEWWIRSDENF